MFFLWGKFSRRRCRLSDPLMAPVVSMIGGAAWLGFRDPEGVVIFYKRMDVCGPSDLIEKNLVSLSVFILFRYVPVTVLCFVCCIWLQGRR